MNKNYILEMTLLLFLLELLTIMEKYTITNCMIRWSVKTKKKLLGIFPRDDTNLKFIFGIPWSQKQSLKKNNR